MLLVLGVSNLKAQGTWIGESSTPFVYDFAAGTGNSGATYSAANAEKSSVSTSATPGFLPYVTSGFARVYTAAAGSTGGFGIQTIPAGMTITASNAAGGNKFSLYNIADLSSVTSTAFTMSFNSTTATAGALIYAFGNSASSTEANNIFNNSAAIASSTTTGIFNFLRWDIGSANAITLSYRGANGTSFTTINTSTFTKDGGTYSIEVYANNSTVAQVYTKSTVDYSLPSGTFNIWVNGTRISGALSLLNFPATGELAKGQPLNSAVIQASRSTSATLLPTTFGNITMKYIPESTLPVSLSAFQAKKNGQSVFLNWVTVSEQNNDYFDIMRSVNGEDFEKIGKVAGNGNSQTTKNYAFTDFNPLSGTNYYFLKQFDKDGNFQDSYKVSINLLKKSTFTVSSANGGLTVNIGTETNEKASIIIRDLGGNTIITKDVELKSGNNTFNYQLSELKEGIYIATVSSPSKISSIKFVK